MSKDVKKLIIGTCIVFGILILYNLWKEKLTNDAKVEAMKAVSGLTTPTVGSTDPFAGLYKPTDGGVPAPYVETNEPDTQEFVTFNSSGTYRIPYDLLFIMERVKPTNTLTNEYGQDWNTLYPTLHSGVIKEYNRTVSDNYPVTIRSGVAAVNEQYIVWLAELRPDAGSEFCYIGSAVINRQTGNVVYTQMDC